MFGHQDDKKDDEKSSEPETVITPDHPAEETATTDASGSTASQTDTAPAQADDAAVTTDATPDSEETKPGADSPLGDDNAWQHPGAPLNDSEDDDEPDDDEDEEADTGPEPIKDIVGSSAGPDFKPFPQSSSDFHSGNQAENTPHELIDIKAKALDDLTPLVGQLDQSPEDKFRTIMMMIQAKDDQSLIQSAYATAHEIKDEKVRAQALLDVVNEINYFTQHPEN